MYTRREFKGGLKTGGKTKSKFKQSSECVGKNITHTIVNCSQVLLALPARALFDSERSEAGQNILRLCIIFMLRYIEGGKAATC